MKPASISAIMGARSVAIVGASSDPLKITGRPIDYMRRAGFSGRIYPVNPGRSEIQGLKSYPSLGAIGEPVDLAIIATSADKVCAAIREGIAAGIGGFVVFSSGFAEYSGDGQRWQSEMSALAKAHDVSIIGPNCIGVINAHSGLVASFTTAVESNKLKAGGFSLASQSGALAAYWLDMVIQEGIGFSKWISTGNECDVDIAQALEYLVEDPDTRIIGLYIEDIKDPLRLRRAAAHATSQGKPVIAIKAGRSVAGAAAAASHTGALAGTDASYQALFEQYGIIRVRSLSEMLDVARILASQSLPTGTGIAIMSVSGGAGVLIADELEDARLSLAEFSSDTRNALSASLPGFSKPQNPIDLTGTIVQDGELLTRILAVSLAAPEVGSCILFIGLLAQMSGHFADALEKAKAQSGKPIIVIWVGAPASALQRIRAMGLPIYADIPAAVAALASACHYVRTLEKGVSKLPAPPSARQAVGQIVQWPEWRSKAWLASESKVKVPRGVLLRPGDKGASRVADFAGPYAAKLQCAELSHKSDQGGVKLNLENMEAVDSAASDLFETARRLDLVADGVWVEEMVTHDVELLVGLKRDPLFGPMLVVGRGGVEVELDPDIKLGLLPLAADEVADLIRSLKLARLLDGYRGRTRVDIVALSEAIASLASRFAMDPSILEVEINPLACGSTGYTALDALVTVIE